MHTHVKMLQEISGRYAPSRTLSFDITHVYKALQLIETRGHISRDLLCKELNLGEGSIKTLVKHLLMQNMIETSNAGTKMSDKGRKFFAELHSSIPAECRIPKCSIAIGKFNHAILLKELGYAIKLGIEQRDAVIKGGGIGATTLLFRKGKFIMPSTNIDSLRKDPQIHKLLIEQLNPKDNDVVIIASSDENVRAAELSAKSAALLTVMKHNRHK
jgi:hypothetical protein